MINNKSLDSKIKENLKINSNSFTMSDFSTNLNKTISALRISTEKEKSVLRKQRSQLKLEINELTKKIDNNSSVNQELEFDFNSDDDFIIKIINDLQKNYLEKVQLEISAFELKFRLEEINKILNNVKNKNKDNKDNKKEIKKWIEEYRAKNKFLQEFKTLLERNDNQNKIILNIFSQIGNSINKYKYNIDLLNKRNLLDKIDHQISYIKMNNKLKKLELELNLTKDELKDKTETKNFLEKIFSKLKENQNLEQNFNLNQNKNFNQNNNENKNTYDSNIKIGFGENLAINKNKINYDPVKHFEFNKKLLIPNNNFINNLQTHKKKQKKENKEKNKINKDTDNKSSNVEFTPVNGIDKESKINFIKDYESPQVITNDKIRINNLPINCANSKNEIYDSLFQMNIKNKENFLITPDNRNDNQNLNLLNNNFKDLNILSIDELNINNNNNK